MTDFLCLSTAFESLFFSLSLSLPLSLSFLSPSLPLSTPKNSLSLIALKQKYKEKAFIETTDK